MRRKPLAMVFNSFFQHKHSINLFIKGQIAMDRTCEFRQLTGSAKVVDRVKRNIQPVDKEVSALSHQIISEAKLIVFNNSTGHF